MNNNKINIRGKEVRENLVKTNNLTPIFRRNLRKEEIELNCACGNPVKKEIYFFELEDKDSGNKILIFTGTSCANDFLSFSGLSKPPLFTLFCNKSSKRKEVIESVSRKGKNQIDFTPLNAEMYQAIGILCQAWKVDFPHGDLLDMLIYLIKTPKKKHQRLGCFKI